jgi:hypothetical protein
MKSPYTNSIFYTNENEVELFKKLGLYDQCFDYRETACRSSSEYTFEFWTHYSNFDNYYTTNKVSVYLPFTIYICDKMLPIVFIENPYEAP